jgi:hypothetical protein
MPHLRRRNADEENPERVWRLDSVRIEQARRAIDVNARQVGLALPT